VLLPKPPTSRGAATLNHKRETDLQPLAKPSSKTDERREKFRKLGQEITKLGDPNVPDYHTGEESKFHMSRGDMHDPDLHDIPLGPNFNTPQWKRTTRKF
jgi:hypothetical protein